MTKIAEMISKESVEALNKVASKGIKEAVESSSDDIVKAGKNIIKDDIDFSKTNQLSFFDKSVKKEINKTRKQNKQLSFFDEFTQNQDVDLKVFDDEIKPINLKTSNNDISTTISELRENANSSNTPLKEMNADELDEELKKRLKIKEETDKLIPNEDARRLGKEFRARVNSDDIYTHLHEKVEPISARGSIWEEMSDEKFEKVMNGFEKEQAFKKLDAKNKISKEGSTSKTNTSNIPKNTPNDTSDTTANNKFFTKENIQKGVGLSVGGYLVLNMFNNGGKMSNAELYGQTQQYGSY